MTTFKEILGAEWSKEMDIAWTRAVGELIGRPVSDTVGSGVTNP
jgi:hypothetical protein